MGRTGRKTNKGYNEGTSITFFSDKNARIADDLIRVMQDAKQDVPPELMRMRGMGGGGGGRGGGGRRGGGGGRRGGGGGGMYTGSNNMPLGR